VTPLSSRSEAEVNLQRAKPDAAKELEELLKAYRKVPEHATPPSEVTLAERPAHLVAAERQSHSPTGDKLHFAPGTRVEGVPFFHQPNTYKVP